MEEFVKRHALTTSSVFAQILDIKDAFVMVSNLKSLSTALTYNGTNMLAYSADSI